MLSQKGLVLGLGISTETAIYPSLSPEPNHKSGHTAHLRKGESKTELHAKSSSDIYPAGQEKGLRKE